MSAAERVPGFAGTFGIANNLPALAGVPAQCLPNNLGIRSSAYVAQVDGASGNLLGSQFIGGSTLATSAVALVGSAVWTAGTTTLPDFPLTPNTVTLSSFGPTPARRRLPRCGRFFATAASSRNAADLLYRRFGGSGAGWIRGSLSAPHDSWNRARACGGCKRRAIIPPATLAGVSIDIGSLSAPLLYVSSTQINFAVPLVDPSQTFATMQLTVGGASRGAAPASFDLFREPQPVPN